MKGLSRVAAMVLSGGALAAVVLLASSCHNGHQHASGDGHDHDSTAVANPIPGHCPVMGDAIDVDEALADPALHSTYKGKTYAFCCKDCKPKFDADPEKVLADPAKPEEDGDGKHGAGDHDHHEGHDHKHE